MRWTGLVIATSLASCMGKDSGSAEPAKAADSRARHEGQLKVSLPAGAASETGGGGGQFGNGHSVLDEGKLGKKEAERDKKDAGDGELDTKVGDKAAAAKQPARNEPASGKETVTRSWFPETFLFEPLIVTDDAGEASVDVRVPDRLTTWRVLALGHTRTGAQAGATTSFLGTLPTYVDPIVPKRLIIGDEVRMPIQMVNTTTAPVTATLELAAEHAKLAGGGGTRTVPAQGSLVEYAALTADHPGAARVRIGLGSTDAVLRAIDVAPAGKPITVTRSGTLAAPRTLTIEGPAGSDPATDRVRLLAFPGALAILRSELGISTARSGTADDAYALLLAGKATALLAALGDQADPAAIRELSIVTTQRAVRHARSLDVDSASLLVEAALAHVDNPVLARLGERAAAYLADSQRPDGTFAGGDGWTLQRVLVATAEATRAVASSSATVAERQRAQRVLVRAGGAFERNFDHVEDGYTAAAILATGAIRGALADKLRTRVRDALKASDDGAKYLDVPEGVVRTDGLVPSRAEATALAVLALGNDPKVADLGATLLAGYGLDRGWGDGRANLACMRAVLELFKTPIPPDVKITLTMDDKPIVFGVLSRDKLRDVLPLDADAPGLGGSHVWKVTAEPAVPGLGFSLAIRGYVPWPTETTRGGLELALPPAIAATVGKPTEIALTAIAPSGIELHVEQALPAGVQVDRPSLEALVSAGTIASFEVADGKVELVVSPLSPGHTFAAKYRVIPTLAGKLHAGASTIRAGTNEFHVPPALWTIN
jgi:hypothetical protein